MGLNDNSRVYNYYDSIRGWEGTTPGWHEVVIHIEDPPETLSRYLDILTWLEENIHGYKKHCRWKYEGNYLRYKFRYERDYIWFKLTWG